MKSLDRVEVRASFDSRFSVEVMAQGYETAYRTVLQSTAEERAIQVPQFRAAVSPSKVTTEGNGGHREYSGTLRTIPNLDRAEHYTSEQNKTGEL